MRTSPKSWLALVALLTTLALVFAACGSDNKNDSSGGGSTTTGAGSTDFSSLSGTINGSGATFPQAFYETAIAGFAEKATNATVNYAGGGSGKGKQDLADGVVDWAGSDSLVKPEDMSKYAGAGGLLYFPTVAAPITVSYNLDGVDELKLDGPTLGGIFSGKIKKWNDPAITATNSGVDLPSTNITIVHRSDASGTTTNFTKYLAAAAPGTWTLGSSDTVNWPSDAQAGNGNPGVAQIVSATKGAIGYVDLADAKAAKLQTASVKNADGKFVAPTLDGAEAALAGATVAADLTYNPLNAPGADAYPITAPTYILSVKKPKASVAKLVQGWINYVLTDGQGLAEEAGFAKLPTSIQEKAVAQLDQIQTG